MECIEVKGLANPFTSRLVDPTMINKLSSYINFDQPYLFKRRKASTMIASIANRSLRTEKQFYEKV